MNAKMNNMLEAAMPAPPPLTSFLKVLLEEGTPADTKDEADADPNFGDLYDKEQNLPQNTARMEACVRGLVRDFNAVCLKRGTTYPNLDRFFDGLAKFYTEGSLQFEDPVKQLLFEEMREKLIRNTPLLRVFLFLAKDAGVEDKSCSSQFPGEIPPLCRQVVHSEFLLCPGPFLLLLFAGS